MAQFNNGYALVVGIANYSQVRPLPATVLKDAADISDLLTNPAYCGYPADHVRHLSDQQATASALREGLRWLAEQTSEDDTAIFFFSGHGGRIESGSQAGNYLILVESEPQQIQKTALESAELTRLLQAIKAGRLLVLFDCCYAGGIGEAKGVLSAALPELKSGLDERLYTRLSEGRGRAIIASSRSDEVSLVFSGMENSLFTHYLLRALRGEARTLGDGVIRLFEAFDFVSQKVITHGNRQHPLLKTNLEHNFPIALYIGGKKSMNTTTEATKPFIQSDPTLSLPPEAIEILQTMFVGYGRVVVKKEFGGGFGGGHVFLVRPIKENDRRELLAVIKMGRIALIEEEWQAFQKYIRYHFPNVARIEGQPVSAPNSAWSGIRYPLVGDGIFTIESLADYCLQATTEDICYVLEKRLFKSLSEAWQSNRNYFEFPLRSSYDSLLPVNLLLEPVEQAAGTTTHPLNPQRYARTYACGDEVELTGFRVIKVDEFHRTVTLNLPSSSQAYAPQPSYRIRLTSVQDMTSYQENQVVGSIIALVKETRRTQLEKEVQQALGTPLNLTSNHVTSPNGLSLPNPFTALPKILRQSIDVRRAYIHGDLHLENVLVEHDHQSRTIRLIDFGRAREDHILHDLFSLESSFLLTVVPKQMNQANLPAHTVIELYERVHCAQLHGDSISAPKGLEKAFATLLSIRKMAQEYLFDKRKWKEYYDGLTIYLLGALRFKNLNQKPTAPMPKPKEVAFWGAAAIVKLVNTPPACDEMVPPPPKPEDEEDGKDDEQKTPTGEPTEQPASLYHDLYTLHEIGVRRLLEQMGRTHFRYSETLLYQQRLRENIQATRRFGNTEIRRAERAEILDRLTAVSLSVLGVPFYELSQESN